MLSLPHVVAMHNNFLLVMHNILIILNIMHIVLSPWNCILLFYNLRASRLLRVKLKTTYIYIFAVGNIDFSIGFNIVKISLTTKI